MANTEKNKYNKMEKILQYINNHFITVSDTDIKKANPVLKFVIEAIISKIKETDPLYDSLFETCIYGGSYFDGLKVEKPNEYDIDLRLALPKLLDVELIADKYPGFVKVHIRGKDNFIRSNIFEKYKTLLKFIDADNYLLTDKILQHFEGSLTKACNKFSKNEKNITELLFEGQKIEITWTKSGPAHTARIKTKHLEMDVDLVIAFKMTLDKLPSSFNAFSSKFSNKEEFLIVPKSPKTANKDKNQYWRLSFQEQEKILLANKQTCKTALRLMKKLRNSQNHNLISSYFIKTVFLHEVTKQDKNFWNAPLSYIFMHMLKKYAEYLKNYNIPYYWNDQNNLLQDIDKVTIDNFRNYVERAINAIETNVESKPNIIGKYLLTSTEYDNVIKALQ